MNIAENLEKVAQNHPNKTALIFEEEEFSYQKLNEMSNQVADSLKNLGVLVGDRVALLLPNIPQFITSYFGIQKLGAIGVTLNSTLKAKELTFILNDCKANVVITTANLRKNINREDLPYIKEIILVEGDKQDNNDRLFSDLIIKDASIIQAINLKDDSPAVILYSSGTTGFPKGVTLSHQNIISNAKDVTQTLNITSSDKSLLFLPASHSYGQVVILHSCFYAGASLVLHLEFELEKILHSIEHKQISLFFAVPTIFTILYDNAFANQLSSLRCSVSAGASLPLEISKRWFEKFGFIINELYGLTETSMVCYNHTSDYKAGSVGRVINGTKIEIVDENGKVLPYGELGEVIVKGPSIMLGYWNLPEESQKSIQDGWFYTGDIGVIDKSGYLSIVERKKDMINVGGQNVYPSEIEQILYSHPAIKEVAVYGIDEPLLGEQVQVAVVLKDGESVTETELIDFCRKSLAHYKLPSVIEFVKSLPKGKSGKILKRILRENYQKQSNILKSLTDMSIKNRQINLKKLCQSEIRNLMGIDLEDTKDFFMVGMNSLKSIQLTNRLSQKLGISLNQSLTLEYSNIDKLSYYLANLDYTKSDQSFNKKEELSTSWDIYDWFPQNYLQRLYYYKQNETEYKTLMNIQFAMFVDSFIDKKNLQIAFQELINNNEIFRLIFDTIDGVPMQKVQKTQKAFFKIEEIKSLKEWKNIKDRVSMTIQEPFNLQQGPIIKFYLFSKSETKHLLLIVTHHIILDGISLQLVVEELIRIYKAKVSTSIETFINRASYIDFMKWHKAMLNDRVGQKSLEYWRGKFDGKLELLKMPTDYPRPSKKRNYGNTHYFQFSSHLSQSLRNLAKNEGVTLYMLTMSVYHLLLYFYTNQKIVLVDTNMMNRTKENFNEIIGLMTNRIAICSNISEDMSFLELLIQIQITILEALKHQGYPHLLLIEQLQVPKWFVENQIGQVWFNLMPLDFFVFENRLINNENMEDELKLKPASHLVPASLGCDYELEMQLIEEEKIITGHINYDTDLYKEATVQKFINNYESLLQKIVDNPKEQIKKIHINHIDKENND